MYVHALWKKFLFMVKDPPLPSCILVGLDLLASFSLCIIFPIVGHLFHCLLTAANLYNIPLPIMPANSEVHRTLTLTFCRQSADQICGLALKNMSAFRHTQLQ